MPMELRKRKAPETAPAPVLKKKTTPKAAPKAAAKAAAKVAVDAVPAAPAKTTTATTTAVKKNEKNSAAPSSFPVVGSVVELAGFGGEIETNDGEKTTLKALVDASKSGVVLFTYPRASTPGCTKQACMFRDKYEPLTAGGLAIYGLSTDSPKANTTFKTNQKLPYPLLCDPEATLIGAIGLKKAPKGTTRGVFVIDKAGKVLLAEAGSPDGTVAAVQKLVAAIKE
ncbi:Thioredoxin-like fold protein [Niveomyces insectorum RCEF 264]|uniref:thioredoxin-dependent peroxiredoxin n=1 Tax=Niveomyces insectorum RCEF 264 TaxID=1081102 RepID=A0A167RUG3_9HYPO|nr:Thioredoxin-like fold protein [Niveomyces insectorum RCEF 264]